MTQHPRLSAVDPEIEAIAAHLNAAIDIAHLSPRGRRALGEALCAALDTVGGGAPRYDAFADMRQDAAFWADVATPMELEIYVAAGLKRIKRATFAPAARKRPCFENPPANASLFPGFA